MTDSSFRYGSVTNRQLSSYSLQNYSTLQQTGTSSEDNSNNRLMDLFFPKPIHVSGLVQHDFSKLTKTADASVPSQKIAKQGLTILQGSNKENYPLDSTSQTSFLLPLEIICDIDSRDSNNGILPDFIAAILAGHPTITSRSLFRTAHGEYAPGMVNLRAERGNMMVCIYNHYKIYAKGAFLIFIPNHLVEKIEKLDLDLQSLHHVSMEEAWLQTDEEPHMEGFKKLFSAHPKQEKAIHIAGHGWVGSPAGLTSENYKEFLCWAEEQHCRGLLITSCYSGGESTLLHIPHGTTTENKQNLRCKQKGVSYPVFVQSIGDFPVPGQFESNVQRLFSKLIEDLDRTGGHTLPRLRKVVREIEKGKNKNRLTLLQVYFPHSHRSPGGFHPVGESSISRALTYTQYRQQQLENGRITVSNLHFLELSPAIINCPIEFSGTDAIFLSMIPGKALHLLRRVDLLHYSPQEYLKISVEMHNAPSIGVTKALFIGTLSSLSKELNQVFVNLKNGECGFRDGQKYYLVNLKKDTAPIEITPLQYILRWKTLIVRTMPKEAAIRSSTGGQQGLEELERHLSQPTFWGAKQNNYENCQELVQKNNLENISFDKLQLLLKKLQPTKSEIISIVYHLLIFRNEATACSLYLENSLTPNSPCIETNVPLLHVGASFNCVQFMRVLMNQDPDLNQPDPLDGSTPIFYALKNDYPELFDLLLAQKFVDLEAQDYVNNKAFAYAIFKPKKLKKIMQLNPHLDLNIPFQHPNGKKSSLLGAAVRMAPIESCQRLLEAGANPNGIADTLSPLSDALIVGNSKGVSLLLKYGANPFQMDENDHYPIVEALQRSSPDVIHQLMESYDTHAKNMNPRELQHMLTAMLIAAIGSGEAAKIRLVLTLNPTFPTDMTVDQELNVARGIEYLFLFGKVDMIKEINTHMCHSYPRHKEILVKQFHFFQSVSFQKFLPIVDRSWDLAMLINQVLDTYWSSKNHLTKEDVCAMILKAKECGFDINQSLSKYFQNISALYRAVSQGDLELAQFCINNGADPKLAAEKIAEKADFYFFELAWRNGLKDIPEIPSKPSLLYFVSRNLKGRERESIFTWLVNQGANVNHLYNNTTPYQMVIKSENTRLFAFCLDHGAINLRYHSPD